MEEIEVFAVMDQPSAARVVGPQGVTITKLKTDHGVSLHVPPVEVMQAQGDYLDIMSQVWSFKPPQMNQLDTLTVAHVDDVPVTIRGFRTGVFEAAQAIQQLVTRPVRKFIINFYIQKWKIRLLYSDEQSPQPLPQLSKHGALVFLPNLNGESTVVRIFSQELQQAVNAYNAMLEAVQQGAPSLGYTAIRYQPGSKPPPPQPQQQPRGSLTITVQTTPTSSSIQRQQTETHPSIPTKPTPVSQTTTPAVRTQQNSTSSSQNNLIVQPTQSIAQPHTAAKPDQAQARIPPVHNSQPSPQRQPVQGDSHQVQVQITFKKPNQSESPKVTQPVSASQHQTETPVQQPVVPAPAQPEPQIQAQPEKTIIPPLEKPAPVPAQPQPEKPVQAPVTQVPPQTHSTLVSEQAPKTGSQTLPVSEPNKQSEQTSKRTEQGRRRGPVTKGPTPSMVVEHPTPQAVVPPVATHPQPYSPSAKAMPQTAPIPSTSTAPSRNPQPLLPQPTPVSPGPFFPPHIQPPKAQTSSPSRIKVTKQEKGQTSVNFYANSASSVPLQVQVLLHSPSTTSQPPHHPQPSTTMPAPPKTKTISTTITLKSPPQPTPTHSSAATPQPQQTQPAPKSQQPTALHPVQKTTRQDMEALARDNSDWS
ncbi:hypothetical protein Pelo_10111 [Pelomyxa schiedti]|nr:hypothetical protein Pelo_10111 [Pelomyxa schiedti]